MLNKKRPNMHLLTCPMTEEMPILVPGYLRFFFHNDFSLDSQDHIASQTPLRSYSNLSKSHVCKTTLNR